MNRRGGNTILDLTYNIRCSDVLSAALKRTHIAWLSFKMEMLTQSINAELCPEYSPPLRKFKIANRDALRVNPMFRNMGKFYAN